MFVSDGCLHTPRYRTNSTHAGQVANGRGHHIQSAWRVVLGTSGVLGSAQGVIKVNAHEGGAVTKETSNNRPPNRSRVTTQESGDAAEQRALHHLQAQGLRLMQRNYRTPGRGGGEIDLIMQEADGTVVFVEVRQRARSDHGGAAASVGWVKQLSLMWRLPRQLACRFDVVAIDGAQLTWHRGAFLVG